MTPSTDIKKDEYLTGSWKEWPGPQLGIVIPLSGPVWLTMEQFKALSDYSCTVPTGVVPGKRWKRRKVYQYKGPEPLPREWLLGYYDPSDEVGRCITGFRQILCIELDSKPNREYKPLADYLL